MGDSQNHKFTYVEFEVGGIQNYILGNGRMKEMIGGSELIESLSKNFLDKTLDEFGSNSNHPISKIIETADADSRRPNTDEILIVQRNAGAVHLVFSDLKTAQDFVSFFSARVLQNFPGLPFFASLDDQMDWNWHSYLESKGRVSERILRQRNIASTDAGIGMIPILQVAPIDGEPAVGKAEFHRGHSDSRTYISAASETRLSSKLISDSDDRLRHNNWNWRMNADDSSLYTSFEKEVNSILEASYPKQNLSWRDIEWPKELDDITQGRGKVAFIHMDGNDFGQMFKKAMSDPGDPAKQESNVGISDRLRRLGKLSRDVARCSSMGYASAIKAILPFCQFDKSRIMPFRPLVLGGDDITVLVRADLAFIFIDAFEKGFEKASFEASGGSHTLSLGMGMVVANAGFPFLKAFELLEDLASSAKKLTVGINTKGFRPGSIDYLVVTNEIENDLDSLRGRTEYALNSKGNKVRLSMKPFLLDPFDPAMKPDPSSGAFTLSEVIKNGIDVLQGIARSQIRKAATECRYGENASMRSFIQIKRNIELRMGGRNNGKLMSKKRFNEIFPSDGDSGNGFFRDVGVKGGRGSFINDYLEMAHLSSSNFDSLKQYFSKAWDKNAENTIR